MIPFAQTKYRLGSAVLLPLALLFSGCGELAYKRGANSSDLESAKALCRAKAPAAYETCMADSGWVVQDLRSMEPMDADPVAEVSVIPSDRRMENQMSAASAKAGAVAPVAASAAAAQPAAPTKKADMLDRFKISSWWKTGSSAQSLAADTDACVAQLGEAHRPDPQTQTVTRGLLLCMKGKGWSGLRAK